MQKKKNRKTFLKYYYVFSRIFTSLKIIFLIEILKNICEEGEINLCKQIVLVPKLD